MRSKDWHIDVGCWRPNMLVLSLGCWWQVTTPKSRVRHQYQISVTNITSRRIKDSKKIYWIWQQVEFHVFNILYRSSTSHSGIYDVAERLECLKMSLTHFFGTSIGSSPNWTILGQTGRSERLKLDVPKEKDCTIWGSESGRSKAIHLDGLKGWNWTVQRNETGLKK